MRKIVITSFITALLTICSCMKTGAQQFADYTPRSTYTDADKSIIDSLKTRLRLQTRTLQGSRQKELISDINEMRIRAIEQLFRHKLLVKDAPLERYVDSVMRNVLNKPVYGIRRKIFILKSAQVNAWCYGAGIYFVTTGLLGRFNNEDEFAFALAHELSHDEGEHIEENILREAEVNMRHKSGAFLRRIASGKADVEDLQEYRKLLYGISKFTRQHELEADSLGFLLLCKSGYNPAACASTLEILEKGSSPKYDIGADLIMPLHSEAYPFQEAWLNERLSVFSKTYSDGLFFETDSMASHPTFDKRKERLRLFQQSVASSNHHSTAVGKFSLMSSIAEFETVEAAYASHSYDQCLYHALQLLYQHPQNTYLISRIGKIFVDLYSMETREIFNYHVPRYTTNYSEELRVVNNFLHNLGQKELGEVGYHFLKDRLQDKSQYYLFWKICELTYRFDERDSIKRIYKEKFGQNITSFNYK